MLIQWPDAYYHTSADTPDKVSPDSLGRNGALAAAYAYWLATPGMPKPLAGPLDGHALLNKGRSGFGRGVREAGRTPRR